MIAMPLPDDICVGDLQVLRHEHVVLACGQAVPLSSREFEIVMMLAEHPGWVLSADQLSSESDEEAYSPESVSVLVSRVRHKLAAAGLSDAIETVRGVGYRLMGSQLTWDEAIAADEGSRALRDASWKLHETVIEVDHSGTAEQKANAAGVIDRARRDLYATLAE